MFLELLKPIISFFVLLYLGCFSASVNSRWFAGPPDGKI